MSVRLYPYGDRAVLAEPAEPADVLPLAAALRDEPGVLEVVPAARTVLVCTDPAHLARLCARIAELEHGLVRAQPPQGARDLVVLDVLYDGADLTSTAAELGMATDALVRAHCDADYVVAFCGFAPGFAYLTGLPEQLHVSRLAQPRTRVPAGSIGIAGEFTGVYPRSSPGGWRLLGRTAARLWDVARIPPALLSPGTNVRFRPA